MAILGSAPVIKSIQTGTIYFPNFTLTSRTATITAVDTTKSFVVTTGSSGSTATYTFLTNSTTVTATGGSSDVIGNTFSWQVIEYV
jgi:hypothetical protein